jgi:hypothetical protein
MERVINDVLTETGKVRPEVLSIFDKHNTRGLCPGARKKSSSKHKIF